MAGLSQLTNGVGKTLKLQADNSHITATAGLTFDETKDEILQLSGFSNRLERVLLALLQEHVQLKERVETDLSGEVAKLAKGLENEKSERDRGLTQLAGEVASQKSRQEELQAALTDSVNKIQDVQRKDRENLSKSLANLEADFQDKVDSLKDDFVAEIKDNIAILGDNINSLEHAIQDDVSKLKDMVCDLGDNLEEEKMSRQDEEKKLQDIFDAEVKRLDTNISDTTQKFGQLTADLGKTLDTLDGKLDENNKDLKDKIDQLDTALKKEVASELEKMKTNQTDLQDKLNGEIQRLADNIQDCENKVLERIYEGEETQKKDSAELRSALDEERMLRGQEAEILKKGMKDAVSNLENKVEAHTSDVARQLEDEKDERSGQYDDMITRLDRERKERMKNTDMIKNQLQDAVDNVMTKHDQDLEAVRDALEREAEGREQMRSDMEKELIKQGKEIFSELDKCRSDFDLILDREAGERVAQASQLRAEMTDNLNFMMKTLEDGQNDLEARIEDDLNSMKEANKKASTDLSEDLLKLKKNVDQNYADQESKLCQEIKDRKSEKSEMIADFEQICRNIDDRITGEKEKLWDKLKTNEEEISHCKAVQDENQESLVKLINEEKEERMKQSEQINDQINERNDQGKSDVENLRNLIELEKDERVKANTTLTNKFEKEIQDCQETSQKLNDFLQEENDKRRQEAEELQRRILKEKEALREYIDNDNKALRDKLEADGQTMKEMLEQEASQMKEKLSQENEERTKASEALRQKLEEEGKHLLTRISDESEALKTTMESQSSELLDRINTENDARKKESDAIKEKMQKEKQELKEYMDRDSKSLKDKLEMEKETLRKNMEEEAKALKEKLELDNEERSKTSQAMKNAFEKEKAEIEEKMKAEQERLQRKFHEEERLRKEKEKEMASKLEKSKESSNELIELFDKVKKELDARKRENDELRDLLNFEKENLIVNFSRGNSEVRDLLEREKEELKKKLDDQRKKSCILEEQLEQNSREDERGRDELETVKSLLTEIQGLLSQPLSVYFTAVREEAYVGGGEEYLTFSSCPVNSGDAMDFKSGIFTVPISGCYLFSLHVCSHDMKKVLAAIRRNGVEVATLFDQNHIDNHKNSMAGQTVLIELAQGDRVQVYLYTFTGLHDKPGNHLTQFLGLLLRPLTDRPAQTEKPKKRIVMSLE